MALGKAGGGINNGATLDDAAVLDAEQSMSMAESSLQTSNRKATGGRR